MPVRSTETRLPNDWPIEQFGLSVKSSDGMVVLISYLDPLTEQSFANYVVLVFDPAIAAGISKYEWSIYEETEEDGIIELAREQTDVGLYGFRPQRTALVSLYVSLLDVGGNRVITLALNQVVSRRNPVLEFLLDSDPILAALRRTRSYVTRVDK